MKRYIQYEKVTGKTRLTPLMTEDDVLQTPSDYLLFETKEELEKYKMSVSGLLCSLPVLPDSFQIQNHNNLLQTHSDITEMTECIVEKKIGHGGKRVGAGRKKGTSVKHLELTKLKIAQTMKGNQNAVKEKR